MTKSPNTEPIRVPNDNDEGRAYRGKARVWDRAKSWNHGGEWYENYKTGRKKFRPKRKDVK